MAQFARQICLALPAIQRRGKHAAPRWPTWIQTASSVRIELFTGTSSNGKTADSGSAYRGSNPCVPANPGNSPALAGTLSRPKTPAVHKHAQPPANAGAGAFHGAVIPGWYSDILLVLGSNRKKEVLP